MSALLASISVTKLAKNWVTDILNIDFNGKLQEGHNDSGRPNQ